MARDFTEVRVTVSNEVTINLGNFENIKPGYEISALLADGANPDEVKEKLQAKVDKWLEDYVASTKAGLAQ